MGTSPVGELKQCLWARHPHYLLKLHWLPSPIVIFSHENRNPALTGLADTRGTPHPSGPIFTHDPFPAVRYDNSYFTGSPIFSSAHPLMVLEASAPAPAGNIVGAQGTPITLVTMRGGSTSSSIDIPSDDEGRINQWRTGIGLTATSY